LTRIVIFVFLGRLIKSFSYLRFGSFQYLYLIVLFFLLLNLFTRLLFSNLICILNHFC
jgi:phage-related holin